MSLGNAYPVKAVHAALVDTLSGAAALRDYVASVEDHFNPFNATVTRNKLTVYVTVEDSEAENPSHSNAGEAITSFLSTRFVLICDTTMDRDENVFQSKTSTPSLLDYEAMVIAALQEQALWGVPLLVSGWRISGVQRDVAVVTANGDIDPQVRRFEVAIQADVIIERTDLGV